MDLEQLASLEDAAWPVAMKCCRRTRLTAVHQSGIVE
jgi:hypothetical protein